MPITKLFPSASTATIDHILGPVAPELAVPAAVNAALPERNGKPLVRYCARAEDIPAKREKFTRQPWPYVSNGRAILERPLRGGVCPARQCAQNGCREIINHKGKIMPDTLSPFCRKRAIFARQLNLLFPQSVLMPFKTDFQNTAKITLAGSIATSTKTSAGPARNYRSQMSSDMKSLKNICFDIKFSLDIFTVNCATLAANTSQERTRVDSLVCNF
jgi:hypothetical protein